MSMMMNLFQDKSSVQYQRTTWNALKNNIKRLVNNANAENIHEIIPKLFGVNLIRGMGLFCRSCMLSQIDSPSSTDVLAALVAVVNSEYCEVGYLLVRRIILQFQRAFDRENMPRLLSAAKFIAHLVNQRVAHTLIAFEATELLLKMRTNDCIDVAVVLVVECGQTLEDVYPLRLAGIFALFRGILHDEKIDERGQFLIECLFAAWEAKFQGYLAVRPELNVVDPEDQMTHQVSLYDLFDAELDVDVFSPDPNFVENEKRYEELKELIVFKSEDEAGSEYTELDDEHEQMAIDCDAERINLRRRMCLTIMTSVDYREAMRKLLDIKLKPGQEMELCIMLVDCCDQESGYLPYYGFLAQQFCKINRIYQENFEKCFVQQYSSVHLFDISLMCNVAKFFAYLLYVDALPWHVLACIRLTEYETTSLSRIFITFLFQELSENLGIELLNERLSDPGMQDSFESIFPKDNPKTTRYAIDFFTSIGLGRITENLREYLKNMELQKAVPESDYESASSGFESGGSESESSPYYIVMSQTDGDNDSDDEWVKITKSTKKLEL